MRQIPCHHCYGTVALTVIRTTNRGVNISREVPLAAIRRVTSVAPFRLAPVDKVQGLASEGRKLRMNYRVCTRMRIGVVMELACIFVEDLEVFD